MKKTRNIDDLELSNIDLKTDGNILIATLNRPQKRNALDEDTIEELIALFNVVPRAGIGAVVLKAAGD
ncbi:MAG: enoyl-CoA hydratase, partial [Oricola sp.]